MPGFFPDPIMRLPKMNVPYGGVHAYISQGKAHQIAFMHYEREAMLLEHRHEAQWGVVLDGRIELTIGGEKKSLGKGDTYFIPKGVPHTSRVSAGYAEITFFDQKDRYPMRE